MKVKFGNTPVEVWKLKTGTVVMDYAGKFWHIFGIVDVHKNVAELILSDHTSHVNYLSTELDWTEPH